MLVYLAGPIDAVGEAERRDWREYARDWLFVRGIATFSPLHAFKAPTNQLGEKQCEAIVTVNDTAVMNSDMVLANLGGKSYGTSLECALAMRNLIPVVAFGLSEFSVYRYRLYACVQNVDSALECIEEYPEASVAEPEGEDPGIYER